MKTFLFVIIAIVGLSFQSDSKKPSLDEIVDQWHLAAANADYDDYFGLMDDSFVFLGTADGERWGKIEFSKFSKPYFDKGKAWSFKARNRNWSFSKNNKIAWFDEELDTWMRDCRGSGILVKKKGEWKIVYYNLTVLIENEKMSEFIALRDKKL
jgi:hypothetical protein